PGGYLTPTETIAGLFLRDGLIRITRERDKPGSEKGASGGQYVDFPMVVLISPETSGGGELIAAALHDNHRAKLVGQRTRGKGSIQAPLDRGSDNFEWPFPGHGVRLTT